MPRVSERTQKVEILGISQGFARGDAACPLRAGLPGYWMIGTQQLQKAVRVAGLDLSLPAIG